LQKTKPATTLGYDSIHVKFLKNLGPKARTWLSKFFSRIMDHPLHPEDLEKGQGDSG